MTAFVVRAFFVHHNYIIRDVGLWHNTDMPGRVGDVRYSGVDRKWLADRQADAIEPERTFCCLDLCRKSDYA